MHFMLEFYGDRLTGRRTSLEHFTTEDVTLGEARIQATSILRYVRFAGGMADLCSIKNERGIVLGEVRATALTA